MPKGKIKKGTAAPKAGGSHSLIGGSLSKPSGSKSFGSVGRLKKEKAELVEQLAASQAQSVADKQKNDKLLKTLSDNLTEKTDALTKEQQEVQELTEAKDGLVGESDAALSAIQSQLAEKEKALGAAQAEIGALDAAINALKASNREQEQQAEAAQQRLAGELAKTETELGVAQVSLAQTEGELGAAQDSLVQTKGELATAQVSLADMRVELDAANVKVTDLTNSFDALQVEKTEKNELAATLTGEVEKLNQNIKTLEEEQRGEIGAKDAALSAMQEQLGAKEKALGEVQADVQVLTQRLEDLDGERSEAVVLSLASSVLTEAIDKEIPGGCMNAEKRNKLMIGLKGFVIAKGAEVGFSELGHPDYINAMAQALQEFMDAKKTVGKTTLLGRSTGLDHVSFSFRRSAIIQDGMLTHEIRSALNTAVQSVKESKSTASPISMAPAPRPPSR